MTELTVVLLTVAGALAVVDWRRGLSMCVLVGIAQDPLRKLAPNQPVYYVVLVGVILALALMRAYLLGVRLNPRAIQGLRRDLQLPFNLFLAVVFAQALHSFARYGSAFMTGIGLLVWLAPIPAVLLAYQYAIRGGIFGVRRLMIFYIVAASISLTGVYLEYNGFDWAALGEVGEGLTIYDLGTILKAYSGFFRSSEIAAWHTATTACFIFTLAVGKRTTLVRILVAIMLISLLVSLGILTGRRKMLVEIVVFLSTYLFLYAWLQRGAARLAAGAMVLGVVGFVFVVAFVEPDLVQGSNTKALTLENANKLEGYAVRGKSVFADVPNRVSVMGVGPVAWAIEAHGWLGAGLGTGSQGTQDVADSFNIRRGAAEGGLGKVTMELGVPGLLLIAWMLVALGKQIKALLTFVAKISPQHARMSFGLVAFLVANAATFSVATQAFNDLFVLLIIGWSLGFVLAMPVLASKGDGMRRRTRGQAVVRAGEMAQGHGGLGQVPRRQT